MNRTVRLLPHAVLAVIVIWTTLAPLGLGQGNNGSILGTIRDLSEAVIQNATVKITNIDTGVVSPTTTDELGNYAVRFLRPGRYRVSAEAAGFAVKTWENIDLAAGREVRIDLALAPGAQTQVMQVTERTPVVETETGTISTTVQAAEIRAVPLVNRDVRDLALLAPGVLEVGPSTGPLRVVVNAAGQTNRDPFFVDGGRATAHVFGDTPIAPNPDIISEVKVLTNSFSAEFSETTGNIVMAVTKSGTNQFHGALFEFFRNDKLNAGNFFTGRRPILRYNQFGGTLGGPIKKNKTFFFFGQTFTRDNQFVPYTNLSVPTADMRRGDFSRILGPVVGTDVLGNPVRRFQIYNPFSQRLVTNPQGQQVVVRDAFPGNVIPPNLISPAARRLQELYPLPTNDAQFANYNVLARRPYSLNQTDIKVDHDFTTYDRLMVRYGFTLEDSSDSSPYPNPLAGGVGSGTGIAPGNLRHPQHFTTANYVRIFSPRLTNSLHLSFFQMYPKRLPAGFGEVGTNDFGIIGLPDGNLKLGTPTISMTDTAQLGSPADTVLLQLQQSRAIVNETTLVTGRQTIKFGGEIRWLRTDAYQTGTGNSSWTFLNLFSDQRGFGASGFSYASFLMGLPADMTYRIFPDRIRPRGTTYALFIQDDIRVSRKLTVNLGLRWDIPKYYRELKDRSGVFDLALGQFRPLGRDGFRRTPWENDIANFGPRFGFAWDLFGNGKTVIRGAYGMFFLGTSASGPNGYLPFDAVFTDVSGGRYTTTDLVNWRTTLDRIPYAPADPTGRNLLAVTTYQDKNAMAYMQQWNLNIGRDFAGVLVQVGYTGSKGTHLPTGTYNANAIPLRLAAEARGRFIAPFVTYPRFPNGVAINSWIGSSSYHALQVQTAKRFSKGLSFTGALSWQKVITVDGSYRDPVENRNLDRGPGALSAPFRLSIGWSYQMPFGRGQKWLTKGFWTYPFGGWEVNGIGAIQSGTPLTPTTSVNFAQNGGAARPNLLRDPELSEKTTSRWFDVSAFALPAPFTTGNAGKGIILSPGRKYINLNLAKKFKGFGAETRNLEFRGEFYNLTNTPQFAAPVMTVDSALAGRILSSRNERIVQLALKFNF